MSEFMTEISSESLTAAIDANRAEWRWRASAWPGIEYVEWPDMILFITGVNNAWFNGVTRTCIKSGNEDERIKAALKRLGADRLPVSWTVGPSTEPADLGTYLESSGFKAEMAGPVMAVDLDRKVDVSSPTGVTIREVADRDGLRIYIGVVASVFKVAYPAAEAAEAEYAAIGFGPGNPMRLLIADLDGKPAGTSMIFTAGGIAWIDDVTVLPEARRRGLGASVVTAALDLAGDLGYHVGALFSSEMGVGLYRKLGFGEYGRWAVYLRDVE